MYSYLITTHVLNTKRFYAPESSCMGKGSGQRKVQPIKGIKTNEQIEKNENTNEKSESHKWQSREQ